MREKFVAHELEIVKRLQKAGVPFLAGTDTPAGVDVLPGFSLHQEMQRFVDAGFTPLEALQTATINPAKFLGPDGAISARSRRARSPTSSCSTRIRSTTSATPGRSRPSSRTAATTRARSWTRS